MKIKRIGDGVFRVTAGRGHVSMLSRYGIFREELRESYAPEARCAECEGGFTFTGTRRTFNARLLTGDDGGFSLSKTRPATTFPCAEHGSLSAWRMYLLTDRNPFSFLRKGGG